jgi:molybdopterin-guanine dinucleotide biosynthesis protein A
MIKRQNITAIILAGGKSTRMGSDKGLMTLNNITFIQHIIDAIKTLVDEILIISDNENHDVFKLKRYNDLVKNVGPLGGIYTGLHYSKTEVNLVISCDVPMIDSELISELIKNYSNKYDVIQTKSNKKTMPLVAIYHKVCVSEVEKWIKEGKLRVREFVASRKLKTINLDKRFETQLFNINTPEQLKKVAHVITD